MIGTSGVEAQAGMGASKGCCAGGHPQLADVFDSHCYSHSHCQANDDEKEQRRLLAGPES